MIEEIYNYRQSSLLTVTISEEWETLCIKFEETLTEERLTMFHKLCDLQSTSTADDNQYQKYLCLFLPRLFLFH